MILVDGFIAGFVLIERSELPGLAATELADLFILKRYRRQGIGKAIAQQLLCSGTGDWLLRCYAQDPPAVAFCRAVLADLPVPGGLSPWTMSRCCSTFWSRPSTELTINFVTHFTKRFRLTA